MFCFDCVLVLLLNDEPKVFFIPEWAANFLLHEWNDVKNLVASEV